VLVVKGCDRLDNLRSLGDCTDEFRAKQLRETREHYSSLMDLAVFKAEGDQQVRAASLLRDLIREAVENTGAKGSD
jgi:(p)ppGpp synthase/HD superfamily hydrolase